jgi:ankyrin repeat protein
MSFLAPHLLMPGHEMFMGDIFASIIKREDWKDDYIPMIRAAIEQYKPNDAQEEELWNRALTDALSSAASTGRTEIIKFLLAIGAQPDTNSLINSVWGKDLETFERFLDAGVDPMDVGYLESACSALSTAIELGFRAAYEVIYRRGHFDRLASNSTSFNLTLELACCVSDEALVTYLLSMVDESWSFDEHVVVVAIEQGQNAIVEKLFSADIKTGCKSLFAAVQKQSTAMIEQLLEIVDFQTMSIYESWMEVLVEAIRWGNMYVIKSVISGGASTSGVIPLELTAAHGWYVKGSLEAPDQTTSWHVTPLSAAILQDNEEAIDLLLNSGVQLNVRSQVELGATSSRWCLTALAACVAKYNLRRLHQCLRRGADPFDNSAIYLAVVLEREDVVEIILGAFAQRYTKQTMSFGSDALCWATRVENLRMVNLLAGYADPLSTVEAPRRYDGYEWNDEVRLRWSTPLFEAIRLDAERGGGSKILRFLLNTVVNLDTMVCVPNKLTPLLYAIEVSPLSLETVRTLVTAGASISLPASLGIKRTPLQAPVQSGSKEIVEYLLQQGADINEAPAARAGATALQLAAIQGFIGIAAILLEHHANINADRALLDGRSAFEGATEHGHIEMMLYLAQNGADLLSNDQQQYRRAIRLAEKNAQWAAEEFATKLVESAKADSTPFIGTSDSGMAELRFEGMDDFIF